MTPLIDIGWNAANSAFNSDRNDVWNDACMQGVAQAILTGTSFVQSQAVATLAQQEAAWFFTSGTHPHSAKDHRKEGWSELWRDPKCVAIGECGLDYFRMLSDADTQRQVFSWHLEQALALHKPVFIHIRDAHVDGAAMLREFTSAGGCGVVHCYTGTLDQAHAYTDMGLLLGCTGWLCDDRRNHDLLAAVTEIPLEFWMLETDAPYLTPRVRPALPSRNVPSNLPLVAEKVALIKEIQIAVVHATTTANARLLFSLPPLALVTDMSLVSPA